MLFFAKALALGISGIDMISKADRFRVASRSGTFVIGSDMTEDAQNT